MKQVLKKFHIDSIIFLIFIFGIKEIVYSFTTSNESYAYIPTNLWYIEHIISFVLGVCFVFVSKSLLGHIKVAWIITISSLLIIIIVNLLEKLYINLSTFLAVYMFLSLLFHYKHFNRKPNPISFKKGIQISGILILCNIVFETANFYIYRESFKDIQSLGDSLIVTITLLFSMDNAVIEHTSTRANNLIEAVIILNILGLLCITFLLLRPIIFKALNSNSKDKQKVQNLIFKYGTNPISSIILENDKHYFFSQKTDGVIGYTVVNNVAVAAGDPICCNADLGLFLLEFKEYCTDNFLQICFCQISATHRKTFENLGFSLQEYGKEAIINLNEYSLAGSKVAKIRWANNKMDKLGVCVSEYLPLIKRDENIENQINIISSDWLKMKGSSELSFTLGTISLDMPFDRRYFIAKDSDGNILGFIVCFPYISKKGYFIDITRRRQSAPLGIMEKLVIGTCEILKKDGVEEVSLGLAPLANINYDKNLQSIVLHGTFKFIYQNLNSLYGFKSLYNYKKKYNPSLWESRYIAFSSKVFTPQIGYAMLKAKNPKGIHNFIFSK